MLCSVCRCCWIIFWTQTRITQDSCIWDPHLWRHPKRMTIYLDIRLCKFSIQIYLDIHTPHQTLPKYQHTLSKYQRALSKYQYSSIIYDILTLGIFLYWPGENNRPNVLFFYLLWVSPEIFSEASFHVPDLHIQMISDRDIQMYLNVHSCACWLCLVGWVCDTRQSCSDLLLHHKPTRPVPSRPHLFSARRGHFGRKLDVRWNCFPGPHFSKPKILSHCFQGLQNPYFSTNTGAVFLFRMIYLFIYVYR